MNLCRKRIASRSSRTMISALTALLLSMGLILGASPTGAVAQTGTTPASLPLLLPSSVPQGYALSDVDDTPLGADRSTWVILDQSPDGARRVLSQGVVYGQSATEVVKDLYTGVKPSKVEKRSVVHHQRAVAISGQPGQWTIIWAEGSIVFSVSEYAKRATFASVKAIADSVRSSRLPDGSFSLAKAPAGTARIFAGSQRSLYSGDQYQFTYASLDAELTLSVIDADPALIAVVVAGAIASPITVRSKPGVLYDDGDQLNLVWMEAPHTLLAISSADVDEAALRQVAESLAPVDAAVFKTAKAQAKAAADLRSGGGSGAGGSDGSGKGIISGGSPVGAGQLDAIAWAAFAAPSTANERCVQFAAADVRSSVCVALPLTDKTLVWTSAVVGDRRTVFGLTSSKVTMVVVRDKAGTELARAATVPYTGNPTLRLFALQVGAAGTLVPVVDGAAVVVGLDAAGAEVVPAVAVKP